MQSIECSDLMNTVDPEAAGGGRMGLPACIGLTKCLIHLLRFKSTPPIITNFGKPILVFNLVCRSSSGPHSGISSPCASFWPLHCDDLQAVQISSPSCAFLKHLGVVLVVLHFATSRGKENGNGAWYGDRRDGDSEKAAWTSEGRHSQIRSPSGCFNGPL